MAQSTLLQMAVRGVVALVLLSMLAFSASALSRCQCTDEHLVGDCKAQVEFQEGWFKIQSNTQQCSRVDWYIDGEPKMTIVTDGVETEQWLGQSDSPELTIRSCKICEDSAYSARQRSDTGGGPPDTLVLHVDGRSWIEVHDARDRELVFTLYRGSDTVRLQGWGPFEVFLGNSPAVTVTFNGRPVVKSAFTENDNTAHFLVGANGIRRH